MISLIVTVTVDADRREGFLEAIRENSAATVRDEPGCLAFTVCEDVDDRNRFVFYEVYRDEEAVAEHRRMPHFAVWRDAVSRLLEPGQQKNILARQLWSL